MPRDIRPLAALAAIAVLGLTVTCTDDAPLPTEPTAPEAASRRGPPHGSFIDRGKKIFRFDTFGDETFWTDTLQMHTVIATSVSPATALEVGLKVDAAALPRSLKSALRSGTLDLDDPANTLALIKLGAVLGVVGVVNENNELERVGITCALCHSTVDNSLAPGIGRRLDGWPNRDLDVGGIIALSPTVAANPELAAVYQSWGPGMYDPRFNIDGQNIPVVIPGAFGLRHVKREIYTGDDDVSYWNEYVAVTQMHGHGEFNDPRIGVSVSNPPDLVSAKLPALRAYQLSLDAPRTHWRRYSRAERRGAFVFWFVAGCARCHLAATLSDVNFGRLHDPEDVGQDPAYALRSATKRYRTTPLRGLWHPPQLTGPYFHDGSAATLEAVVDHYVRLFDLTLTGRQKADLVAYLKTL